MLLVSRIAHARAGARSTSCGPGSIISRSSRALGLPDRPDACLVPDRLATEQTLQPALDLALGLGIVVALLLLLPILLLGLSRIK